MWPVVPHRITLRTCQDLDWRVTVTCPKCRISRMIQVDKTPERLRAVPLDRLFARGACKCSKAQYGCAGTPAERLTVDAMHGGQLKQVAAWNSRSASP